MGKWLLKDRKLNEHKAKTAVSIINDIIYNEWIADTCPAFLFLGFLNFSVISNKEESKDFDYTPDYTSK
jgi:hypothetical protein